MMRITDRAGTTLLEVANVSDPAVFRALPPTKVVCRYRVVDPTTQAVWHVDHRRADSPLMLTRKAIEAAPEATRARPIASLGCQAWMVPYGDEIRIRCLNDFVVLNGTAILGHSSTFRPDVGGVFRDDPPGDHQVWKYIPITIPPTVVPNTINALREALNRSVTAGRRRS